jgi:hypothetical protein
VTERKIIDMGHESRSGGETLGDTEPVYTTRLRKLVRRLHHASKGGALPLSLADDAAEAIEQMMDVLIGATAIAHLTGSEHQASRVKDAINEMYIASRFGRSARHTSDDLTEVEVARLRLLNQKLVEVEQWVLQRRDQCLRDYFKAGGVKDQRYSDELWEDIETKVKVACILRENHPDFNAEDDNIVAQLHWLDGIYDRLTESTNWNAFQFHDGHRLQHDHHCYLFHDLSEHVLFNDWDRMLDIGGIWVDVHLIPQRGVYW